MGEWRAIPGWPEYEASTDGEIRNVAARRGTRMGRLLKQRLSSNGYLMVTLSGQGVRKTLTVHRLILETFAGSPPDAHAQCAHGDGSRQNNRAENLRWVTARENSDDARRHGRLSCGERNGSAKLTADAVTEIRTLRAGGMLHKQIAARFGVARSVVSRVLSGARWAHAQTSKRHLSETKV